MRPTGDNIFISSTGNGPWSTLFLVIHLKYITQMHFAVDIAPCSMTFTKLRKAEVQECAFCSRVKTEKHQNPLKIKVQLGTL